ncbi:hypothetical protein [Stutzerimonas nitrititolerans]|uniref:hypothetical protein n=1 Tax=Stutzerimonas nitrititolerans TaxID=2482751 RepID=UPI002897B695|nr:hypothetical protein [Stutzerimonas nitrititolerans]
MNLEQLEQITARRSSKFHPALLRQRAGVHWTMDGTLTLVDADAPTPSASGIGTAVISVFDRLACIQRELIEKAHRLLVLFWLKATPQASARRQDSKSSSELEVNKPERRFFRYRGGRPRVQPICRNASLYEVSISQALVRLVLAIAKANAV